MPLIKTPAKSADHLDHLFTTEKSAVRKRASMDELSEQDYDIPPVKYEYLDHTADVQIHGWGETLQEAFEQCAVGMFGYMTDLDRVEMTQVYQVEAEGHDMQSLLFHFLDELLFMFCAEPYIVAKKVIITEFDLASFKIKATALGEEFTIGKHSQNAEVKAITYSAMQILDRPETENPQVFVIVDI